MPSAKGSMAVEAARATPRASVLVAQKIVYRHDCRAINYSHAWITKKAFSAPAKLRLNMDGMNEGFWTESVIY